MPQLRLNLLAAPLQDVHCHLGMIAILQHDRRGIHGSDLICRQ